ncbi:hypothetical protein SKAU_G00203200 [Synaphobranchus kaupii]|uniref:Uncharacterized protein n=1 Tax=Synaphobranchus kaupii TaxID=118154 RepID=A0A9Q1FFU5_SYNKA|nr:hypothetical protein SKAU_G00203200 [Synaphobranchus kaupii]
MLGSVMLISEGVWREGGVERSCQATSRPIIGEPLQRTPHILSPWHHRAAARSALSLLNHAKCSPSTLLLGLESACYTQT